MKTEPLLETKSHPERPASAIARATGQLLRTPAPVSPAPRNVVVPNGPGLFDEERRQPVARPERHTGVLVPLAAVPAVEEARWQELAESSAEPNPLFEPWVALTLASGDEDVRVAQVWGHHASGARRLDGLLVLRRRSVGAGLEFLQTWRHPLVPLGVPLVRAGMENEVAAALLDLLATQRLPLLRLDDVPADGPFHRALVHQCWLREWPLQLSEAFTRALFRPARDASAFLQTALSGKRRRELRKAFERLQSLGPVRFTQLDGSSANASSALESWTRAYAQLEAQGWKGQEGVAVGGTVLPTRSFEQILREALLRDRLLFLALELDGRPIAMNVALLSGEGGFGLRTTYDESLARFMPGVQLYLQLLERLHQMPGLKWMDSCSAPDRALMNQLWPERRELHSLVIAADHPLASAMAASIPMTRWVRRWLVDRATPRAHFRSLRSAVGES